jgi:hypothetical protein
MKFQYIPKSGGGSPQDPFTLDRVWARDDKGEREISHLLDRSYQYRSPRELQWHLADRFGRDATSIDLSHR